MRDIHFAHSFFFFNDTATTEIYTLSLHDALPISKNAAAESTKVNSSSPVRLRIVYNKNSKESVDDSSRSEEHTSELQSQSNFACRLLLEKNKKPITCPIACWPR